MEKKRLEYLDLTDKTFVRIQTSDKHYIVCSFEESSSKLKTKPFEYLAHDPDSQQNFITDLLYIILNNQLQLNSPTASNIKLPNIAQEFNLVKENLDYFKNSVKGLKGLVQVEELIKLNR